MSGITWRIIVHCGHNLSCSNKTAILPLVKTRVIFLLRTFGACIFLSLAKARGREDFLLTQISRRVSDGTLFIFTTKNTKDTKILGNILKSHLSLLTSHKTYHEKHGKHERIYLATNARMHLRCSLISTNEFATRLSALANSNATVVIK